MNVRVLFVALVICTFLTTVAQAATLCVKPGKKGCYATISAAVSAAASGDTVDVTSGSYQEMVTITNSPYAVEARELNSRANEQRIARPVY